MTKEGMRKGIEGSAAFLLFLSKGVLLRPFCQVIPLFVWATSSINSPPRSQFEIREAVKLKKPIVCLHEADTRYGEVIVRQDF